MNQVVTLTPNAVAHIKKSVEQQHAAGFRLAVKKTGCSGYAYVPNIVQEGKEQDLHFQIENLSIFVEKEAVNILQGTLIDYIDQGLGQSKLIFHNPNAANQCGCGESFNLLDE
ncbi:MAG: iron-sulfur cluster assembly accessory protein [Gammaproteobacteria bacterium]|nr:iron-sulfur cluster assembly accessory protein [Gammaproteobacteria bacterium]